MNTPRFENEAPKDIIQYAEKMEWWAEWMKEYRYGMIMIYPPEPINTQVNELRSKYRRTQYSNTWAHISLSVPIPQKATQDDINEIIVLLSKEKSFNITYGPIVENPPVPWVVLAISPQEKLEELIKKVESTKLFSNAIERKYPFKAHITIAENITMEQTHQITEELKDLPLSWSFQLWHLSFAVPEEDFTVTERLRIPLS